MIRRIVLTSPAILRTHSLSDRGNYGMATVTFIGLGVMGYPMAGHLKTRGGHDVTVFNRNGEKAKKWADEFHGKHA
ncbi:NAD(P)-binding domain-containing protein, partial [Klebsiella aerogenes]|uniref:NAD(P)-binding domain-containing protein n=1 Tax=Klebsiella aerogenes TaxID=548 RepID=UPI0019543370